MAGVVWCGSVYRYLAFVTAKFVTMQEMHKHLLEVSSRDHSAYDAFVLVILSHGNKDGVYGVDGVACEEPAKDPRNSGFVLRDDITSLFDVSSCESLGGKPKMYFIQACQGGLCH